MAFLFFSYTVLDYGLMGLWAYGLWAIGIEYVSNDLSTPEIHCLSIVLAEINDFPFCDLPIGYTARSVISTQPGYICAQKQNSRNDAILLSRLETWVRLRLGHWVSVLVRNIWPETLEDSGLSF